MCIMFINNNTADKNSLRRVFILFLDFYIHIQQVELNVLWLSDFK